MGSVSSEAARLESELATRIEGRVLVPGAPGFDDARRVWNGRFQRSPAVIARCVSAADVAEAVRFARAKDLPISVKGGGHAYAGNTVAEGSLLIDLAEMSSVAVDADARRARVGGGAVWRQVDEATQAHGLATTGGTVSSVGVAGFTLGAGQGWLTRTHGFAMDNLVAADVVTASGDIVRADAGDNPDLFWGLRGGGGNFGVVTTFEFALHPLGPDVYAGQIFYPIERGAEMLRFFRDHMRNAPDELMAFAFFLRVPPIELFPAEYHGKLVIDLVVAWFGPLDEGEAALEPFRAQGDPVVEFVGPQPYLALQQAFDVGLSDKGNRWYTRAHYFDELPDEAIDEIVSGLGRLPGELTTVYLGAEGGAAGRIAHDATSFPHRSACLSIHVFPGWLDAADDEPVMNWARALDERIAPYANGGVYVNLLADDEAGRIPNAYGDNYARLRTLKARWDPDNIFRMNHNIEPGS